VKLLIIRPQPGADATAKRARDAGFEPIIMPLFAIEPLPLQITLPADYDAILLTSGNAVRALGKAPKQLEGLPLYAVGAATARALEQASLHPDCIGTDGVDALISLARKNGHRKLLWLAGEEHSNPKSHPEVYVDIHTVYRSTALPLPPDFARTLAQADAVMLHSTRAAQHFAGSCDGASIPRHRIRIAAFSPAIASSAGQGWASIFVAAAPNDTVLLSEVQRHFITVTRDP
jgi:uroporphyrinogen-III synthase